MEFFIKKNATLPLISMKLIMDGRNGFRSMTDLSGTTVTFSMKGENGPRIIDRPCVYEDGVLFFKFKVSDTGKLGRYEGEFAVLDDNGRLVLPLKEKIFINIVDSFVTDGLEVDPLVPDRIKADCCSDDLGVDTFFLITEDDEVIETEDGDELLWAI